MTIQKHLETMGGSVSFRFFLVSFSNFGLLWRVPGCFTAMRKFEPRPEDQSTPWTPGAATPTGGREMLE